MSNDQLLGTRRFLAREHCPATPCWSHGEPLLALAHGGYPCFHTPPSVGAIPHSSAPAVPRPIPLRFSGRRWLVNSGPGPLPVPSLNTEAHLQPGSWRNTPLKDRDIFALVAWGNRGRERHYVKQFAKTYKGPRNVVVLRGSSTLERHETAQLPVLMQRAVFVPCPSADMPYGRRFSDAILNGAIPVLFMDDWRDPRSRDAGRTFWRAEHPDVVTWLLWQEKGAPIVENMIPEIGRRLKDYTVMLPYNAVLARKANLTWIQALERIPEAVVQRKHEAVAQVRHLFLYNYMDSGRDAFSVLLRTIYRKVILNDTSPAVV